MESDFELELCAISHAWPGGGRVLEDVSLTLAAGEASAIIGPNGAGKTTLVRIAAGLLEPSSGQVRLGGDAVRDLSRRELARRMALVPQTRPTVFDFSVLEFVLMGLHARNARFSLESRAQREAARRALTALEVDHLAARPVTQLSGGEQQRVLMARALIAQVPLWLLDEPTANLDLKHQMALLTQVVEHTRSGGCALAVLHDLNLVHRFFDRVIVLHQGAIVADGAPDEVLDEKLVSTVFEIELEKAHAGGQVVWIVR